jgi:hypothetical protein
MTDVNATPPPLDEPAEKTGMRNAWGRIAAAYEQLWTERTAHLTARGLDLLAPDPAWDGCDNPRAALRHIARVLRPGGRLMLVVWGRAQRVWFSPVIELIESRAQYYASVCPMMFFYGLPGVLSRMVGETGLTVLHDEVVDARMRFPSVEAAAGGHPRWPTGGAVRQPARPRRIRRRCGPPCSPTSPRWRWRRAAVSALPRRRRWWWLGGGQREPRSRNPRPS